MRIVGADVRVPKVVFAPVPTLFLGAGVASCRLPLPEVREMDEVWFSPTRALNPDHIKIAGAAFDSLDTNDGKFIEPVPSARERVFSFEASASARVQIAPVLIK